MDNSAQECTVETITNSRRNRSILYSAVSNRVTFFGFMYGANVVNEQCNIQHVRLVDLEIVTVLAYSKLDYLNNSLST